MSRLAAVNVSVSFGSLVVLDGVSLSIGAGDRIGIIAPNESASPPCSRCWRATSNRMAAR